jgi:hypothetical protein
MEAKNKTKETRASFEGFLKTLPEDRRKDCLVIHRIMKRATRAEAKMWGTSCVGYGKRRLKYASGRELDWFLAGFSPRKANLTLYIMTGPKSHPDILKRLGKHKAGVGCLYVKRLSDVELPVLEELVQASIKHQKAQ